MGGCGVTQLAIPFITVSLGNMYKFLLPGPRPKRGETYSGHDGQAGPDGQQGRREKQIPCLTVKKERTRNIPHWK